MIRIKNNITPRLPNEYQEVEYIESTGTQYIDTGVAPTNKTNIKLDIEFISGESNSWIPLIAERTKVSDYSGFSAMFGIWINSNTKEIALNYVDTDTAAITGTNGDGRHIYSNTENKFYLDNTLIKTLSTSSFTSTINLYVFALNELFIGSTNIETRNCTAKLYELKIYDDNILIRDFVPCYRKSDNEIGMYDLVSNQFYTNVNLKPIIGNKKVLKKYIGENLVYGKETPNYEQKVNYTMLYYYGDECTDITGGWSIYGKYRSPTISKNTDHLYINISSGWKTGAFGMTNSIDLTNFTCLLSLYKGKSSVTTKVITVQTSKATNSTYGSLDNVTGRISYLELPYTTASQSYLKSIDLSNVEGNYFINCGLNIGTGNSCSLSVYALALVKEDDWQTLAEKAGITATSIDDILTNSTMLLSNEDAVEFMIYNCTGDFMASAIQSETFLTALNNSSYKTIIQANEHWNKFLNMVS